MPCTSLARVPHVGFAPTPTKIFYNRICTYCHVIIEFALVGFAPRRRSISMTYIRDHYISDPYISDPYISDPYISASS
ncbi:hypothetical protein CHAZLY21_201 [Vibrio phage Chazly21]|nr:hypothetical protein CHAZLY21_201 [Vibrio phage Chazly21]